MASGRGSAIKALARELARARRPKPIPSRHEDSLPKRQTDRLAKNGWDYRNGAWRPPKRRPPRSPMRGR